MKKSQEFHLTKKPSIKMRANRGMLYFLTKMGLVLSTKCEMCGIHIAFFGLKKTHPAVWKFANALAAIQAYDPFRLALIKRDVSLIWVFEARPSRAVWNEKMKTCILDRAYVLSEKTSPVMIASTIVHEATHARLHRRGIGYDQRIRKRVEDICHNATVRFGKKLPDGGIVLEEAKSYLNLPSGFYSNEAREERELAWLRETNALPKWLTRLLERRVEKRRMLRKSKSAADSSS
jgi:hypothetical protein